MPYGRGGAGNIAQAKEESKRAAEDTEANRPLTSAAAPPPTTSPIQPQAQDFAHMGRGGAGNWYEPSKLEQGSFNQASDPTAIPTSSKPQISTPWHPENQELPVARAGRGGAGNFVWRAGEEKERERREEEEKVKEIVNEKVERDVEIGLAKPSAALLGGEKAGRGW